MTDSKVAEVDDRLGAYNCSTYVPFYLWHRKWTTTMCFGEKWKDLVNWYVYQAEYYSNLMLLNMNKQMI